LVFFAFDKDRYGLEADAVLHLKDGKYALIEFKLWEKEIEKGAEHLCKIERLIKEKNKKETQCSLDLPSLKIIITGGEFGYKRDDGVLIIPIGCLKDQIELSCVYFSLIKANIHSLINNRFYTDAMFMIRLIIEIKIRISIR